jgi:tetratricopeptide (TPR) repeat protein
MEERQILASLQHPGIAGLLDGGSTEDGSPYLVMEYVEGVRLDEWLKRESPALAERIRVFVAICAAVEYAHRHLVVHRDLKPANIMITPEGSPVLLDFGVARLLDPFGSGITQTGTRLLTPRFASPEQVRGQAASTATDIYSLGVLLFVMLTGHHPYAEQTEDTLEILRAVCTEEPARPSASPGPWRKALRGELDAITLQCLRKDPEERYRSVSDLSGDLGAWAQRRPVRAHPPSPLQRAAKLIRRNAALSAASAAAVVFLIAGSGVSLWEAHDARQQRLRAEMRFDQVKRLAHSVLFDLHDAIQRLPGSTAARRLLAQQALDYLKELEATSANNRDLVCELAAAYIRVGDVQAQLGKADTGGSAGAIASQLTARRLAAEAAAADPGDERALRLLLDASARLSNLYEQQGDMKAQLRIRPEVETLSATLAARHPDDPKLRVRAVWYRAETLSAGDDAKVALSAWEKAVSAAREAADRDPHDPEAIHYLESSYRNLGDARKNAGDLPGALESYRRSTAINERRVADDPAASQPKMDLYLDLVLSGWVSYRSGQVQSAVANYERAAHLLRGICASDPDDLRARLELAKLLITAAPAYQKLKREADTIARLREALGYLEWAMTRDPHNDDARVHHGWALLYLADVWAEKAARRGPAARHYWRLAAETYERSLDSLSGLPPDARFDDGVLPGPMIERARHQLPLALNHLPSPGRP